MAFNEKKGLIRVTNTSEINDYDIQLNKVKDKTKFNLYFARYRVYYKNAKDIDYTSEQEITMGQIHETVYISQNNYTFEFNKSAEQSRIYNEKGIEDLKPFKASGERFNPIYEFALMFELKEEIEAKNLKIKGVSLQQDIVISWECKYQDAYKLNVYRNDEIIYTKTEKTKNTQIIIPKNSLKEGTLEFELEVQAQENFDYPAKNKHKITKEIKDLGPKLYKLEYNKETRELLWDGANLPFAIEVELYSNTTKSIIFNNKNVLGKKYKISQDLLFDGITKCTVYAKNEYGEDSKSIDITVKDKPYILIYNLEPDKTSRNFTKDIIITWNSYRQEKYTLTIEQNGKKVTQSGGKERKYVLKGNTFKNEGKVTIILNVFNNTFGKIFNEIKTANFNVYGGVNPPVVTTNAIDNIINVNYLQVNWNETERQAYYKVEFDIIRTFPTEFDSDVRFDMGYKFDENYTETIHENSGIIYSKETSYKSKNILLNNDVITNIQVTIYDILKDSNSNLIEDKITVKYDISDISGIKIYADSDNDNGRIIVYVEAETNDAEINLYRNNKLIAENIDKNYMYIDNRIKSNKIYSYYAIVTKNDKSYKSNKQKNKIKIKGFLFSDDKMTTLNLNLEHNYNEIIRDGKTFIRFLGKNAPDVEKNEEMYIEADYSCLISLNEFEDFKTIIKENEIVYRDSKGRGYVCNIANVSINDSEKLKDYISLSFKMVQINSKKDFD